ncbi:MAG: hypothetical protein IIA00_08145 [Proteobacteria bacterium]|nr:hypothetical protein [Pseudomonadota bacterium]
MTVRAWADRQVFGVCLAVCICIGGSLPTYAESQDFDLEDVIAAIKDEIRTAQATESGEPRLKIDRVEVELTIVAEQAGEAGVNIKVPIAGGQLGVGGKRRTTHKIKLVLIPSTVSLVGSGSKFGLVSAIQRVKESLRRAIHKPPALKLENFVFEVEFMVQRSAKGGISFLIFEVSDLKSENLVTHKLRIYMSLAT